MIFTHSGLYGDCISGGQTESSGPGSETCIPDAGNSALSALQCVIKRILFTKPDNDLLGYGTK